MGHSKARGRKFPSRRPLSRKRLALARRRRMKEMLQNVQAEKVGPVSTWNNLLYNFQGQQYDSNTCIYKPDEMHDYIVEAPPYNMNSNIEIASGKGSMKKEMEVTVEEEIIEYLEIDDEVCNNKCRICSTQCSEMHQIFGNDDEIPKKIMAIAKVQVEEGDGLPAAICLSCYQRLNISYDFKCQIQRSDENLRQVLQFGSSYRNGEKDLSVKDDRKIDNGMCTVTLQKQNVEDYDEVLPQNANPIESNRTAVHPILQVYVQDYAKDQNMFISGDIENTVDTVDENYLMENTLNDKRNATEFRQIDSVSQNCGSHLSADMVNRTSDVSPLNTDTNYVNERLTSLPFNQNNQLVEDREQRFKIKIRNDLFPDNDNGKVLTGPEKIVYVNPGTRLKTNCSDKEISLTSETLRRTCPLCSRSFGTELSLQKHMITHKHGTKLRYIYYLLDKPFTNVSKLEKRIHTIHESNNRNDEKTAKENVNTIHRGVQNANLDKTTNINKNSTETENTKSERKRLKYVCKFGSEQGAYQKTKDTNGHYRRPNACSKLSPNKIRCILLQ